MFERQLGFTTASESDIQGLLPDRKTTSLQRVLCAQGELAVLEESGQLKELQSQVIGCALQKSAQAKTDSVFAISAATASLALD